MPPASSTTRIDAGARHVADLTSFARRPAGSPGERCLWTTMRHHMSRYQGTGSTRRRRRPSSMRRAPFRAHAAFTLVELLFVLAVMAVVGAIAVPRFASAMNRHQTHSRAWMTGLVLSTAQEHSLLTSSPTTVRFTHGTSQWEVVYTPLAQAPLVDGLAGVNALLPASCRRSYSTACATGTFDLRSGTIRGRIEGPATYVTPIFGTDDRVRFDGSGRPDSSGSVRISLGSSSVQVAVRAESGQVEITP